MPAGCAAAAEASRPRRRRATAQGAALLAKIHARLHCADLAATRQALDAAPVWLLGPGREHWDALQGMGLRTLGDLRSLPRSGLTRRFGAALLDELDRALGHASDPRTPIVLPPVFESRLELFARADTTDQVLHGAEVLLARLVAWLGAQHAFARRFTLGCTTRRAGAAAAARRRRRPRSRSRWRSLRATPITCWCCCASALPACSCPRPRSTSPCAPTTSRTGRRRIASCSPARAARARAWSQLIERLQARLGPEQVQRLQPVEDHRPECGSRSAAAGGPAAHSAPARPPGRPAARAPAQPRRLKPAAQPSARAAVQPSPAVQPSANAAASSRAPPRRPARPVVRPTWLLTEPEPLPERQSRPLLGGEPLQLLSGPERIEAGWWDSALAERDYFIAQAADGALVWIYRARLPLSAGEGRQGWFMQGRFG